MVRRLREIVAPGCRQAFFLVMAASLMWATLVTRAASETTTPETSPGASLVIDEALVITRGDFTCDGGVACTIANIPKVFAQACKVTGGTLSGNQCLFDPAPSEFGTSSFLAVAEDIFEAHLLEQAKAAAATASQISMNAIQAAMRDIRDRLQDKAYTAVKEKPQGLGARSSYAQDTAVMGLTRSPTTLPGSVAVWVQGYVDREWHDSNFGFLDGRTATTAGAIGGIDYTSYRLFSANDAFVVGILTGVTEVRSTSVLDVKTRIDGPSVGFYGVYVNGGFSADFNAKVDFLALDQSSVVPLSSDLRTYATAANLNYKFDVGGGWIEPTVGAIYTVTRWDSALSALDGHTVRVQGGVRFGQSFSQGGVTIEPTLLALLYSDVVIEGGNINTIGIPLAPTDEGRLFEQASLKLNFDFGNGLSSSIEGEVRHGDLNHGGEVVGAAGRIGLRYKW
jgi:hypothetical protein